jgi:hypothetical protein
VLKGNLCSKKKCFRSALESYSAARNLSPDNTDLQSNIEILERIIALVDSRLKAVEAGGESKPGQGATELAKLLR